jgi:hypothetical protein
MTLMSTLPGALCVGRPGVSLEAADGKLRKITTAAPQAMRTATKDSRSTTIAAPPPGVS